MFNVIMDLILLHIATCKSTLYSLHKIIQPSRHLKCYRHLLNCLFTGACFQQCTVNMAEQLYCSGIYSHQNLFVQDICWHVLFIVHDVISSHKTMVAKKGHPRPHPKPTRHIQKSHGSQYHMAGLKQSQVNPHIQVRWVTFWFV